METTALHRNSIEVAKYTVGVKSYKTIKQNQRVKMREVKIYRNGTWIYCDAFKDEECQVHERWAMNFLHAMKHRDVKGYMEQLNQMKGF